jgi:hypothetical protein
MPNSIAIVCTIEELHDYMDTAAGTRMFALNISSAVNTTVTPPLSDTESNLLSPWTWTLSGIKIAPQTGAAMGAVLDAALFSRDFMLTMKDARQVLADRMAAILDSKAVTPRLLLWDPLNPGGVPRSDDAPPEQTWPQIVGHASTYPAPLPHALNLVLFFTLKIDDLKDVDKLYAAPVFTLDATTYTPLATGPTMKNASADFGDTFQWIYSDPTVTAYQPPFNAKTIPGGGILDFSTMWIAIASDSSNEDWRTTLEQRIADSFDVAQVMLDGMRAIFEASPKASPLDTAHFEDLRLIVVSLLRDTADFGLRYAPDGVNLLRYIVTRVVKAAPDTFGGFDLESWLAAAQAALVGAETLKDSKSLSPQVWSDNLQKLFTAPVPQALLPIDPSGKVRKVPTFGTLLGWLEELQTRLADDVMLATVLLRSWSDVFGASTDKNFTAAWGKLFAGVTSDLTALSSSHALRKRALQANFGGGTVQLSIWNKVVAPVTGAKVSPDKAQIRKNIVAVLKSYYHTRLGDGITPEADFETRAPLLGDNLPLKIPTDLKTPPSLPAAFASALSTNVESQLDGLLKTLLPDDPTSSDKPHPIILQVHNAVPTGETDDPLRGIAGVAVLAKQSTANNWNCLHTVSLSVLDSSGTSVQTDLQPVSFIPQRLSYRNGLLQAAISYSNKPLIAESPSAIMGQDIPRSGDDPAEVPLFRYDAVPVKPDVAPNTLPFWARISGLKFGADYSFLAFAMRNSGALPFHLAASPETPWVPKLSSAFTPPAAPPPAPAEYRRRVPVGPMRFVGKGNTIVKFGADSLPAIPDSVEPMAKQLLADYTAAQFPPGTPNPDPTAPKPPLLLLWQSTGTTANTATYKFSVRPPAVDFETWSRWIDLETDPPAASGADPATIKSYRNTRAAVFADTSWNAPKDISGEEKDSFAELQAASVVDCTINDAAVKGIVLSLTRISGTKADGDSRFFAITPPQPLLPGFSEDGGDGLNEVQGNLVTVTVNMGASDRNASLLPGGSAGSYTVSIPAGQVWKLSITPAISDDDATRLENFMTTAPKPGAPPPVVNAQFAGPAITVEASGNIRLSNRPLEMLIEGARSASLTPVDLWNTLTFAPPTAQATALSLTMNPANATASDWHLVRRVEVQRQVWRWMGRPFLKDDFPDKNLVDLNSVDKTATPQDGLRNALAWEVEAFAEREVDSIRSAARPDFGAEPPKGAWPVPELFHADLTDDLRAQYFRFSATMYSRYEGLPGFQGFATGDNISALVKFNDTLSIPQRAKASTPWKRLFWPCRIDDPKSLARPKVLLCIPLMRPLRIGDGKPSSQSTLLVILDEPWYQTGGLAEQLELMLDIASVQLTGQANPTQLAQLGPDAIFKKNGLAQKQFAFKATGKPMGTTFDEASAAPLFANTCFQFDLTSLAVAAGVGSLDRYQAKVHFVRSLREDRTLDGALFSPITESTWVEFQPSSDHFTSKDGTHLVHVSEITFTTGKTLSLSPEVTAGPLDGDDSGTLQLWMLLMRDVIDATGHAGEAYVGLYRQDGSFQAAMSRAGAVATLTDATHLYLLEVHTTKGSKTSGDWTVDLFPADGLLQDVSYRVVRLSERIESAVGHTIR